MCHECIQVLCALVECVYEYEHLIVNPLLMSDGWYDLETVTTDPAWPLNWKATVPVWFLDAASATLVPGSPKKSRSMKGGNMGSTDGKISQTT